MKKLFYIFMFLLMLFPISIQGRRGCCSHHGGVSGSCTSSGRIICNDGQVSPSCTCTPSYIYGCTDSKAKNYNANANKDNGSCIYYRYGCNNKAAINYDSLAERNDGSCQFENTVETTESIPYETIYQEKDSDRNGEVIVKNGKNGTKKIVTKVITNENGEVLSRTVQEEEIIEQPSNRIIQKNINNKITQESVEKYQDHDSSFGVSILVLIILLFVINVNYVKKHREKNYLLSYIYKTSGFIKYVLLTFYIILLFPVLIDFAWIILEKVASF